MGSNELEVYILGCSMGYQLSMLRDTNVFCFFLPLFRFLLKLVQEPQESRRTQQHHIKDSSDSRQLQSLCKAENTKSEELLGGENKVINRLTVAKRFLRSVCVCVCDGAVRLFLADRLRHVL